MFTALILLQVSIWDSVGSAGPLSWTVLAILLVLSLFSWTITFGKWSRLRAASTSSAQFVRAFRKANNLQSVALAMEQFRSSPMVTVFDYGYTEVERQVKARGTLTNQAALERTLQLGISEEMARLEHQMNWLATTATVSPFIGLFGTVFGIIRAFSSMGEAGSSSLRAVAPGISEALIATAFGLAAAIPAAVAYNYFGHLIREFGGRMEDFCLEFLNLAERSFEE
ncbi:MAG: MotA/TolQ/ExbB proton channel family protein [Bryobacteraceae bacterium]|nr:MotA/TolQ/ExbB proton channel family protein [Bryobacteraceae bacterium]